MSNTLFCPSCGVHQSKKLANLLSHIRLIHSDEPNFTIDCRLQGCCRTFKNYCTYRNHIYAFHSTSTGELYLPPAATVSVSESIESDDSEQSDIDSELPLQSDEVPIQKSAAMWTLKVCDGYSLPQSTTEQILKDVDSLYKVRK